MSKRAIPAGAVVRGTDKGYVHGDLKPGSERPVEKIEKTYPYMRPRDAATLILVRMKGKTPEVLMGCRAAAHAFMPNRYVFPGGRVDRADAHVPIATPLDRFVECPPAEGRDGACAPARWPSPPCARPSRRPA